MMEGIKKRERSSNFTKSEVRLLIELVAKYRTIIENKKTDTVTNKEKEATWDKITNMFNGSNGGCNIRNTKTLKLKYEGIKKETKKKLTKQRQETYRTGGGSSTAPALDEIEEKVTSICSNLTGLESRNDSDDLQGFLELEQHKSEIDNSVADEQQCIVIEDQQQSSNQYVISLPCNESNVRKDEIQNGHIELHCYSTEDNQENNDIQKENKWTTWNPKALKSKKSQPLNYTNSEKISKVGVTKKIDELTSARQKLVQLQTEIARKEHEFIQEEHKMKMLHLENEEKRKQEIHNLLLKKMEFQK